MFYERHFFALGCTGVTLLFGLQEKLCSQNSPLAVSAGACAGEFTNLVHWAAKRCCKNIGYFFRCLGLQSGDFVFQTAGNFCDFVKKVFVLGGRAASTVSMPSAAKL